MTIVYLRESVVFLLNKWNLFYLLGLILLVALILLLPLRMNLRGAFFEDILREKNAKQTDFGVVVKIAQKPNILIN